MERDNFYSIQRHHNGLIFIIYLEVNSLWGEIWHLAASTAAAPPCVHPGPMQVSHIWGAWCGVGQPKDNNPNIIFEKSIDKSDYYLLDGCS